MTSEINLIKLTFNDNDFKIIRNIRKKVFTDELGISESELIDKHDKTCDHFILFDGKNSVGSVRFTPLQKRIKLERMAILSEFRLKKYGRSAISQLKEYYSTQGYTEIILDSIYDVRGFYQKCGFLQNGEIFKRVELEHVKMSLTL